MIFPFTILLSSLMGIVLLKFMQHSYISFRLRNTDIHTSYAVMCLGAALYIFCNIQLYRLDSVNEYVTMVQVQMYGTAAFHIGLLWFTTAYTKTKRNIVIPVSALFTFFIIARHADPTLLYHRVKGISLFILPWGEELSILQAEPGWWNAAYQLLLLSVYLLVYHRIWKLYRKGEKKKALLLFTGICVMLVGVTSDMLVFNLNLKWMFLGETGFVALIIMMGVNLSNDIINAGYLAKKNEENEKIFHAIFESTFQFIGMLDKNGRLMEANESACSFINTEAEKLRGIYFWDAPWWKDLPDEQSRLKESIAAAARGESVRYMTQNRDREGNIRHIDFSLKPVKDLNNHVLFIVPEGRDITEFKAAEEKIRIQNDELSATNEELTATIEELEATNEEFEAQNQELLDSQEMLRESQLKFKALFDAAGDAIFIMDDRCFLDCNARTLDMFGCGRRDIIGRSPVEFSPAAQPDGRSSMDSAREKISLALDGHAQVFEWKHRRLDGNLFDAEVSLSRIEMAGTYFLQAIVRDISERKKALEQLEESEEYNRILFHQSHIPIVVIDPKEGIFTDCNEAAVKIYRLSSRTEVIGRSPVDVSAPFQYDGTESSKAAGMMIRKAIGDKLNRFEWLHQRPDGERWDAEVTLMRFNFRGRPMLQFTLLDITDRKRAEKALRDSEERFRITTQKTGIIFYDYNIQTGHIIWSGAIEQVTGFSEQEFRQVDIQTWEKYIHHEDREPSLALLGRAIDHISDYNITYRFRCKNGSYIHLEDHGVVIPGEEGKPVRMLGLKRDISDRIKTQLKLEDTLLKLKKSQEISHVGNWEYDPASRLFASSEEVLKIMGLPENSTFTEKDIVSLIYPEDRENVRRHFSGALEEGKPYTIEYRIQKKDTGETRHIMSMAEVAVDAKGKTLKIFGINQDITEQKLSQEEKEKIQAQLIHAQKMEAIGTLASGLAHDFNNMLAGIMGSMSILQIMLAKEELTQKDAVNEYIKTAQESSARAADMIKQLLTISRRQEMQMAPVDVVLSLKHVRSICRNSFPKSVNIDFRLPENPMRTMADPTQIEQVFLNFCVNASHAMTVMRADHEKEGGTLTVSVDEIFSDSHFYRLNPEATPNTRYIKIIIRDTGVGMDKVVMRRIFEPFFTTKKKELGSGLGLSMAYSIVQQHHGFINVYSEKNTGSSFTIYLPMLTKESTESSATLPERKLRTGHGTILIIDDEKAIIRVAEGILKACGYSVISREIGEMGVDYYREHPSGIDAVLLDMSMPGMSGLEIFEKLKEINSEVKVLLSSGFAEDERVINAKEKGIKGFIQKPYTAEELAEAVNLVLSGQEEETKG